ncbi:hypothetical protein WDU94_000392 [Cyamophila willieti]
MKSEINRKIVDISEKQICFENKQISNSSPSSSGSDSTSRSSKSKSKKHLLANKSYSVLSKEYADMKRAGEKVTDKHSDNANLSKINDKFVDSGIGVINTTLKSSNKPRNRSNEQNKSSSRQSQSSRDDDLLKVQESSKTSQITDEGQRASVDNLPDYARSSGGKSSSSNKSSSKDGYEKDRRNNEKDCRSGSQNDDRSLPDMSNNINLNQISQDVFHSYPIDNLDVLSDMTDYSCLVSTTKKSVSVEQPEKVREHSHDVEDNSDEQRGIRVPQVDPKVLERAAIVHLKELEPHSQPPVQEVSQQHIELDDDSEVINKAGKFLGTNNKDSTAEVNKDKKTAIDSDPAVFSMAEGTAFRYDLANTEPPDKLHRKDTTDKISNSRSRDKDKKLREKPDVTDKHSSRKGISSIKNQKKDSKDLKKHSETSARDSKEKDIHSTDASSDKKSSKVKFDASSQRKEMDRKSTDATTSKDIDRSKKDDSKQVQDKKRFSKKDDEKDSKSGKRTSKTMEKSEKRLTSKETNGYSVEIKKGTTSSKEKEKIVDGKGPEVEPEKLASQSKTSKTAEDNKDDLANKNIKKEKKSRKSEESKDESRTKKSSSRDTKDSKSDKLLSGKIEKENSNKKSSGTKRKSVSPVDENQPQEITSKRRKNKDEEKASEKLSKSSKSVKFALVDSTKKENKKYLKTSHQKGSEKNSKSSSSQKSNKNNQKYLKNFDSTKPMEILHENTIEAIEVAKNTKVVIKNMGESAELKQHKEKSKKVNKCTNKSLDGYSKKKQIQELLKTLSKRGESKESSRDKNENSGTTSTTKHSKTKTDLYNKESTNNSSFNLADIVNKSAPVDSSSSRSEKSITKLNELIENKETCVENDPSTTSSRVSDDFKEIRGVKNDLEALQSRKEKNRDNSGNNIHKHRHDKDDSSIGDSSSIVNTQEQILIGPIESNNRGRQAYADSIGDMSSILDTPDKVIHAHMMKIFDEKLVDDRSIGDLSSIVDTPEKRTDRPGNRYRSQTDDRHIRDMSSKAEKRMEIAPPFQRNYHRQDDDRSIGDMSSILDTPEKRNDRSTEINYNHRHVTFDDRSIGDFSSTLDVTEKIMDKSVRNYQDRQRDDRSIGDMSSIIVTPEKTNTDPLNNHHCRQADDRSIGDMTSIVDMPERGSDAPTVNSMRQDSYRVGDIPTIDMHRESGDESTDRNHYQRQVDDRSIGDMSSILDTSHQRNEVSTDKNHRRQLDDRSIGDMSSFVETPIMGIDKSTNINYHERQLRDDRSIGDMSYMFDTPENDCNVGDGSAVHEKEERYDDRRHLDDRSIGDTSSIVNQSASKESTDENNKTNMHHRQTDDDHSIGDGSTMVDRTAWDTTPCRQIDKNLIQEQNAEFDTIHNTPMDRRSIGDMSSVAGMPFNTDTQQAIDSGRRAELSSEYYKPIENNHSMPIDRVSLGDSSSIADLSYNSGTNQNDLSVRKTPLDQQNVRVGHNMPTGSTHNSSVEPESPSSVRHTSGQRVRNMATDHDSIGDMSSVLGAAMETNRLKSIDSVGNSIIDMPIGTTSFRSTDRDSVGDMGSVPDVPIQSSRYRSTDRRDSVGDMSSIVEMPSPVAPVYTGPIYQEHLGLDEDLISPSPLPSQTRVFDRDSEHTSSVVEASGQQPNRTSVDRDSDQNNRETVRRSLDRDSIGSNGDFEPQPRTRIYRSCTDHDSIGSESTICIPANELAQAIEFSSGRKETPGHLSTDRDSIGDMSSVGVPEENMLEPVSTHETHFKSSTPVQFGTKRRRSLDADSIGFEDNDSTVEMRIRTDINCTGKHPTGIIIQEENTDILSTSKAVDINREETISKQPSNDWQAFRTISQRRSTDRDSVGDLSTVECQQKTAESNEDNIEADRVSLNLGDSDNEADCGSLNMNSSVDINSDVISLIVEQHMAKRRKKEKSSKANTRFSIDGDSSILDEDSSVNWSQGKVIQNREQPVTPRVNDEKIRIESDQRKQWTDPKIGHLDNLTRSDYHRQDHAVENLPIAASSGRESSLSNLFDTVTVFSNKSQQLSTITGLFTGNLSSSGLSTALEGLPVSRSGQLDEAYFKQPSYNVPASIDNSTIGGSLMDNTPCSKPLNTVLCKNPTGCDAPLANDVVPVDKPNTVLPVAFSDSNAGESYSQLNHFSSYRDTRDQDQDLEDDLKECGQQCLETKIIKERNLHDNLKPCNDQSHQQVNSVLKSLLNSTYPNMKTNSQLLTKDGLREFIEYRATKQTLLDEDSVIGTQVNQDSRIIEANSRRFENEGLRGADLVNNVQQFSEYRATKQTLIEEDSVIGIQGQANVDNDDEDKTGLEEEPENAATQSKSKQNHISLPYESDNQYHQQNQLLTQTQTQSHLTEIFPNHSPVGPELNPSTGISSTRFPSWGKLVLKATFPVIFTLCLTKKKEEREEEEEEEEKEEDEDDDDLIAGGGKDKTPVALEDDSRCDKFSMYEPSVSPGKPRSRKKIDPSFLFDIDDDESSKGAKSRSEGAGKSQQAKKNIDPSFLFDIDGDESEEVPSLPVEPVEKVMLDLESILDADENPPGTFGLSSKAHTRSGEDGDASSKCGLLDRIDMKSETPGSVIDELASMASENFDGKERAVSGHFQLYSNDSRMLDESSSLPAGESIVDESTVVDLEDETTLGSSQEEVTLDYEEVHVESSDAGKTTGNSAQPQETKEMSAPAAAVIHQPTPQPNPISSQQDLRKSKSSESSSNNRVHVFNTNLSLDDLVDEPQGYSLDEVNRRKSHDEQSIILSDDEHALNKNNRKHKRHTVTASEKKRVEYDRVSLFGDEGDDDDYCVEDMIPPPSVQIQKRSTQPTLSIITDPLETDELKCQEQTRLFRSIMENKDKLKPPDDEEYEEEEEEEEVENNKTRTTRRRKKHRDSVMSEGDSEEDVPLKAAVERARRGATANYHQMGQVAKFEQRQTFDVRKWSQSGTSKQLGGHASSYHVFAERKRMTVSPYSRTGADHYHRTINDWPYKQEVQRLSPSPAPPSVAGSHLHSAAQTVYSNSPPGLQHGYSSRRAINCVPRATSDHYITSLTTAPPTTRDKTSETSSRTRRRSIDSIGSDSDDEVELAPLNTANVNYHNHQLEQVGKQRPQAGLPFAADRYSNSNSPLGTQRIKSNFNPSRNNSPISNRGQRQTMSYISNIRANHITDNQALFGDRKTPQASSTSVPQPKTRSIFSDEDEDLRRSTYQTKVINETSRHHSSNYPIPGPSSMTKQLDNHRLLSGTPRSHINDTTECRSYHSEGTTESEWSRRMKRSRHDSIGSDSDDGVPSGCGKALIEPQPSPYATHSRATAISKSSYGAAKTNTSMYRGHLPGAADYLSSPRLPSFNGAAALSAHSRHRDNTSYRTHGVPPGHSCRSTGDYRSLNSQCVAPLGAPPTDDSPLPLVDNLLRHGLPQISEDAYIYYNEPLDPPSCSSSCVNLCAAGSDIYDDLDSVSVVGMRALQEKTLRKYAEKRAREEEKERRRREAHAHKRRKQQEYV